MQEEFCDVTLIAPGEAFNGSFTRLTRLSKLLRRARPALCDASHGGIAIAAPGDPYQLPIVLDFGTISPMDSAGQLLQETQLHLVRGALYLELTKSARQKANAKFSEALSRIRVGCPAEDDASYLNECHLALD